MTTDPQTTDLPDRLEAVLTERFTELGNPFSEMRRHEQGPDGWPASHPVGPRLVAEVLRELLAAAPAPAPAPAVRPELRDQIAALFRHPPGVERLGDATPGEIADAVLSVLPATTNRAAEEAYRLALSQALRLGTGATWEAIRDRAEDLVAEVAELAEAKGRFLAQQQGADGQAAALNQAADFFRGLHITGTTITAAEAEEELRRMAVEAQQQTETPACPDPIECDHEAALGQAQQEIRDLREKHKASLRRADKVNNELMEEVQRYAIGAERPVLWSVYNRMHSRASHAEAALNRVRRIARRLASHAAGFKDVLDASDHGPWGRTVGADIAELIEALPDQPAVVAAVAGEEPADETLRQCPALDIVYGRCIRPVHLNDGECFHAEQPIRIDEETDESTLCGSEYPGDDNFVGQLCGLPKDHFGDHRCDESIGAGYTVKLRWPAVSQPGKEPRP